MRRDVFIVILLTMFAGCSNSGPPASVEVAKTANAEQGEEVAHPEYAHWSQFPIGAKTVRRKEVSNDQGKVVVTTTVRLIDKNDRQVVVETQVTVERSGDPKLDNPPFTAEYPATFRLPKSMTLEQFHLPSLKAKLEGEEEMEILGQKYKVEKYVWLESNEAGPMDVIVWRCDKVPGRTVREESLTKSLSNKSLEEVVAIEIPANSK
jgi:hypothetical protein